MKEHLEERSARKEQLREYTQETAASKRLGLEQTEVNTR